MMPDIEKFIVRPSTSVSQTMERIDELGEGIALVVDEDEKFLDTVTDGDIRRSLLGDATLDSPIGAVVEDKGEADHEGPVTAVEEDGWSECARLFDEHDIRHLPILDGGGRVVDLVTEEDLDAHRPSSIEVQGVVMAGGFGTRLRPLTEDTPKPMLPLDGRPLLEHIVDKLEADGVEDITLTIHYKADQIRDHFDNGDDYGVDISYVHEEQPMGTAGFLEELGSWDKDLLIINGDVLTDADFREIVGFHREHDADFTVAVREHEVEIPYGTLEMDGFQIGALREKPSFSFFINTGIYVLSPEVCNLPYEAEMTELIKTAMRNDLDVLGYPLESRWIDIGEPEDYQRAKREIDDFDL